MAAQQVLQEQLPAQLSVEAPVVAKRTPRKRKSIEDVLNTPVENVFGDDLVGDNFSDNLTAQRSPQFSKSQELQRALSII